MRSKKKRKEAQGAQEGPGWIASFFGAGAGGKATPNSISLPEPPKVLKVSETKNEQEETEVAVTRLLVSSYFGIVSKNLQDLIPKIVVHFMVNTVKSGLQKRLVHLMYKEDLFTSLTREHDEVAMKRERCQKNLKALHVAAHTLDSIPKTLGSAIPPMSHPGPRGQPKDRNPSPPKRSRNDLGTKENANPNLTSPEVSKTRHGPLGRGLASVLGH